MYHVVDVLGIGGVTGRSQDLDGNTPFHFAAEISNPALVPLFTARDFGIATTNKLETPITHILNASGNAAIHIAVMYGNTDMVDFLISVGDWGLRRLRWQHRPQSSLRINVGLQRSGMMLRVLPPPFGMELTSLPRFWVLMRKSSKVGWITRAKRLPA